MSKDSKEDAEVLNKDQAQEQKSEEQLKSKPNIFKQAFNWIKNKVFADKDVVSTVTESTIIKDERNPEGLEESKPGLLTQALSWVKSKIAGRKNEKEEPIEFTKIDSEIPHAIPRKAAQVLGLENPPQQVPPQQVPPQQVPSQQVPPKQPLFQFSEEFEKQAPIRNYLQALDKHLVDGTINNRNYKDPKAHADLVNQQVQDLRKITNGQDTPELHDRLVNNGETIFKNQMNAYKIGLEGERNKLEQAMRDLRIGTPEHNKLSEHCNGLNEQIKHADQMLKMPNTLERSELYQAGAKADQELQKSRAGVELPAPKRSFEITAEEARKMEQDRDTQPNRRVAQPRAATDPAVTTQAPTSSPAVLTPEKIANLPPPDSIFKEPPPITPLSTHNLPPQPELSKPAVRGISEASPKATTPPKLEPHKVPKHLEQELSVIKADNTKNLRAALENNSKQSPIPKPLPKITPPSTSRSQGSGPTR